MPASVSSSASVYTVPVGLLGEQIRIALVRGPIFASIAARAGRW